MSWQDKPNTISDPIDGPFFVVQSPDGNTLLPMGITNDGDLTIGGISVSNETAGNSVEPYYSPNTGLLEKLTTKDGTKKVKEEILTWANGKMINVDTKYYDSQENLLKTISESISYNNAGKVKTISKTVT